MDHLASIFVGNPLHILGVAATFLLGYLALEIAGHRTRRHRRPSLIACIAWGLYAAWEWLVLSKTPEANIRVDLLVIWPVMAVFSLWAIYRTVR